MDIKKQRLLKRIITDITKILSDRYGLELNIVFDTASYTPGSSAVDPDKFVVRIIKGRTVD